MRARGFVQVIHLASNNQKLAIKQINFDEFFTSKNDKYTLR